MFYQRLALSYRISVEVIHNVQYNDGEPDDQVQSSDQSAVCSIEFLFRPAQNLSESDLARLVAAVSSVNLISCDSVGTRLELFDFCFLLTVHNSINEVQESDGVGSLLIYNLHVSQEARWTEVKHCAELCQTPKKRSLRNFRLPPPPLSAHTVRIVQLQNDSGSYLITPSIHEQPRRNQVLVMCVGRALYCRIPASSPLFRLHNLTMFQLPRGNWDSHCHVFSPDKYPFARDTPYTPPAHAVDELLANSPCDNHVIVMSLAEGTDCSSMLDAIQTHRAIRGDARGVAVLSDDQLKDVATCRYYYQAGVRSVRIHEARIRSMLGKKDLELDDLVAVFIDTARAIHDIKVDWSIEAQLDLTIWAGLIPTLRSLKDEYSTTFVVDHTFNMTPRHLTSPDFKTVLQGLKEGFIWVKLLGG